MDLVQLRFMPDEFPHLGVSVGPVDTKVLWESFDKFIDLSFRKLPPFVFGDDGLAEVEGSHVTFHQGTHLLFVDFPGLLGDVSTMHVGAGDKGCPLELLVVHFVFRRCDIGRGTLRRSAWHRGR